MSLDSSYFDDDIFGNSLSNGINGFPTGIVIAAAAAIVLFIIALIAFKTARKIFGGVFMAAGIGGVVYGFIRMDSLESKLIRTAMRNTDKQMLAAFIAGGVVLLLGIIMLAVGSSRNRNTYTGQMQPPPNYQMPNTNYQMPNQSYQAPNQNYQMQQPQNYVPQAPAQVQCNICQALNNPGSKFCCNCGNQL